VSLPFKLCYASFTDLRSQGAAPSTLSLIIFGPVVLACGSLYELYTTRDALFPPTAFKDMTTGPYSLCLSEIFTHFRALVIILVVTFLHNFAFNAGTFYLAFYFQVSLFFFGLKWHY